MITSLLINRLQIIDYFDIHTLLNILIISHCIFISSAFFSLFRFQSIFLLHIEYWSLDQISLLIAFSSIFSSLIGFISHHQITTISFFSIRFNTLLYFFATYAIGSQNSFITVVIDGFQLALNIEPFIGFFQLRIEYFTLSMNRIFQSAIQLNSYHRSFHWQITVFLNTQLDYFIVISLNIAIDTSARQQPNTQYWPDIFTSHSHWHYIALLRHCHQPHATPYFTDDNNTGWHYNRTAYDITTTQYLRFHVSSLQYTHTDIYFHAVISFHFLH